MQNYVKKLWLWAGIVLVLLIVPFLMMHFHIKLYDPGSGYEELNWGLGDFIFAALLLYGAGFIYITGTRNIANAGRRSLIGVAVFLLLAFIWAGAATGFEAIIEAVKNF